MDPGCDTDKEVKEAGDDEIIGFQEVVQPTGQADLAQEQYSTPVKKRKKQRAIAYSGPTTLQDNAKNNSAAKRLKIFEEITSPGETAATIRDSSGVDSSQSESEEESGKLPATRHNQRQEQRSFFEWTKFYQEETAAAAAVPNHQVAAKGCSMTKTDNKRAKPLTTSEAF